MELELDYYKQPGILTDLASFTEFTNWLSPDPRVIFQVAQGLIIHDAWVERYGITTTSRQRRDKCTVSASDILTKVSELRNIQISAALPRSPEERMQACCREYAVLTAAFFKAKGIPSRARCGFALYLAYPDTYEDHWICEYWNGSRWIAIDSQIDPFQQSVLYDYANAHPELEGSYKNMLLTLDPLDLTSEHFINAGDAWKSYRNGDVDPNKFGIGRDPAKHNVESLQGAWFMRGQLLRDFASLNKIETVPFLVMLEVGRNWNDWRLVSAKDDELSDDDWKLLDKIAELCSDPDGNLADINQLFEDNQDLRPLL
jgi:hypothetical protein